VRGWCLELTHIKRCRATPTHAESCCDRWGIFFFFFFALFFFASLLLFFFLFVASRPVPVSRQRWLRAEASGLVGRDGTGGSRAQCSYLGTYRFASACRDRRGQRAARMFPSLRRSPVRNHTCSGHRPPRTDAECVQHEHVCTHLHADECVGAAAGPSACMLRSVPITRPPIRAGWTGNPRELDRQSPRARASGVEKRRARLCGAIWTVTTRTPRTRIAML
jgi:hypothetical protein